MSEEILNYLENDKNYSVDCNDGSYYLELPYREAHEIKDLITNLQQENKQLKSILTELEEWLKENKEICKNNANIITEGTDLKKRLNYRSIIYGDTLDKIQELKEMYKC